MTFTPKAWQDYPPNQTTKINAAALIDMETRLAAYTDSHASSGSGIPPSWYNVKDYGALGNGSNDDTSSIMATFTACKAAGGGTVYFPSGVYACAGALNFNEGDSITFRGPIDRIVGAGTNPVASIRYTGIGSSPFITLGSVYAYTFIGLKFQYSNSGYTGDLIVLDWSTYIGGTHSADPSYNIFHGCAFESTNFSIQTARSLISVNHSVAINIEDCSFFQAQRAICLADNPSRNPAGGYSVVARVARCGFNYTGLVPISTGSDAEAIVIEGCWFEGLTNGQGGCWEHVAGYLYGGTFRDNWGGDVGAVGGNFIRIGGSGVYGGLTVTGNRVEGGWQSGYNTMFLKFDSFANGVNITGNEIDAQDINGNAIDFAGGVFGTCDANQLPAGIANVSSFHGNSVGLPIVNVSGTPTTGQILTATSATAADWQTPPGLGSGSEPYIVVDSLSGTPRSVTDWGPLINTAIASGTVHFLFGAFDYPFSTPLNCYGVSAGMIFEGAWGHAWYASETYPGTRLIWKGSASPTVSKTDGVLTAGSMTVLTSPSAPWAQTDGVYYNGQPITIHGAGPSGTDLVTQIAGRNSTTQVTLANTASTPITGASFSFTDWVSAINGRNSTGLQFRDMQIRYDDVAFDGILIDMRSGEFWSANGELSYCYVGGIGAANSAYTCLHINGMGEMFRGTSTVFGAARANVRGHYNNNTDDAKFDQCTFGGYWDTGAIVNPGRFWEFDRCVWSGGNALLGPCFACDGVAGVASSFYVKHCSMWDFGSTSFSNGAIAGGSNLLNSAGSNFDKTYANKPIAVAGAGVAAGWLVSSIAKVNSATQLVLADVASTPVTGAHVDVTSGYAFHQKPGYSWDISVEDHFFWFCPTPEFKLLGTGRINIERTLDTRPVRSDLTPVLFGPYIDLGDSSTNKKSVKLNHVGPGAYGSSDTPLLVNYAGHDLTDLYNFPQGIEYRAISPIYHETMKTLYYSGGGQPAITAHSGQTLDLSNTNVEGHDYVGILSVTTTGSGATAGALVDIAFFLPWPTLQTYLPVGGMAQHAVTLTPTEWSADDGGWTGAGANAAAAGAYAIVMQGSTGWTLGISNAVTGAKRMAWSYRITKL